jgi:hypothetical protein
MFSSEPKFSCEYFVNRFKKYVEKEKEKEEKINILAKGLNLRAKKITDEILNEHC